MIPTRAPENNRLRYSDSKCLDGLFDRCEVTAAERPSITSRAGNYTCKLQPPPRCTPARLPAPRSGGPGPGGHSATPSPHPRPQHPTHEEATRQNHRKANGSSTFVRKRHGTSPGEQPTLPGDAGHRRVLPHSKESAGPEMATHPPVCPCPGSSVDLQGRIPTAELRRYVDYWTSSGPGDPEKQRKAEKGSLP